MHIQKLTKKEKAQIEAGSKLVDFLVDLFRPRCPDKCGDYCVELNVSSRVAMHTANMEYANP